MWCKIRPNPSIADRSWDLESWSPYSLLSEYSAQYNRKVTSSAFWYPLGDSWSDLVSCSIPTHPQYPRYRRSSRPELRNHFISIAICELVNSSCETLKMNSEQTGHKYIQLGVPWLLRVTNRTSSRVAQRLHLNTECRTEVISGDGDDDDKTCCHGCTYLHQV